MSEHDIADEPCKDGSEDDPPDNFPDDEPLELPDYSLLDDVAAARIRSPPLRA